MKVSVRVTVRSSRESVRCRADGVVEVKVNVAPADGQANRRVAELLAEHFGVPKSRVRLVAGQRGRNKVFELPQAPM